MSCKPHNQRDGEIFRAQDRPGWAEKGGCPCAWAFLGLAGECPTPAQLSRNVSVQRALRNYVSDYLYIQPLHSIPTRGKERREAAHRRWERSPPPAWQLPTGVDFGTRGLGQGGQQQHAEDHGSNWRCCTGSDESFKGSSCHLHL